MTTTTTIVILGSLSALGFSVAAALPVQAPGDIPWKDLAGGGAALLMLVALVVFLRFLSQDRASRDAERAADRVHIEKVVGDCSETAKKLGEKFAETQTSLVAAMREDQRDARRELHDLIQDRRPT